MKFLQLAVLFASATFTLAADIPETAIAAGSFGTLVAALTAADLVDTLSAPNGPYTVFAPTDDAFGALPAGLVECLLLEENKEALTAILTYHVLGGEVLSTDLTDGMMAATLQGENVTVDLTDGVKISDAVVSAPDVETSNGVIHIIDSVLVPPSIDVGAFFDTCPSMAPSTAPSTAPSSGAVATKKYSTVFVALIAFAGLIMM
mmetsp:Transcript_18023/g.27872  ORF Transcript_18023/g.27872 Transcript_18023/m.27872 type:complete len:204 (-) Transcript_18023:42-653(-)